MRIRILLAAAAAAGVALGQTTVTDTITTAAGEPISGTCTIQPTTPFTSAGGYRVVGVPTQVRFTAGAFTVALQPTDTGNPGPSHYVVNCAAPQQTVGSRTVGPSTWGPKRWIVPTSGTPLTIAQVEVTTVPTPSLSILPGQISGAGLADGTYCLVVVDHVISLSSSCPGGGGGGGGLAWGALTSSQWGALTSSQWAALTN